MSAGFHSVVTIGYPIPGELIAAGVVLPAVALVVISARYLVRFSRNISLGVDNWLLIPALLGLIGMGACIIIGVRRKAFGYLSPPPAATSMEALSNDIDPFTALSENILTIFSYCFIKLSIVSLYRRIFIVSGHTTILNVATWTLVVIIIGWSITFLFLFIFNCNGHVAAQWGSREDLPEFCGAGLKHQEALYISEFCTNILLVFAPIPSLFSLRLKTSVKFQVLGILLLAFLAFAASIVRLILTFQIADTVTFGENFDIDQTNSTIFYESMIEASIALIACCLPVLKPLVTDRGIASAIASIRSRISISSMRSNVAGSNSGTKPGTTDIREGSLAAPLKSNDVELQSMDSHDNQRE